MTATARKLTPDDVVAMRAAGGIPMPEAPLARCWDCWRRVGRLHVVGDDPDPDTPDAAPNPVHLALLCVWCRRREARGEPRRLHTMSPLAALSVAHDRQGALMPRLGSAPETGERISMAEAARVTGCDTQALRRRLARKGLATKIGGRWFTSTAAIASEGDSEDFRDRDDDEDEDRSALGARKLASLPTVAKTKRLRVQIRPGLRRGRLVVLERLGLRHPKRGYAFRCECTAHPEPVPVTAWEYDLRGLRVQSCGCAKLDAQAKYRWRMLQERKGR